MPFSEVLEQLRSGRLPDASALGAFIEFCSPHLHDGPFPPEAEGMREEYLRESGITDAERTNLPFNAVGERASGEKADAVSMDDLAAVWRNRLFNTARQTTDAVFGKRIFIRGLIEISNFCHCNCRYCGIRAGNSAAQRYRLESEQIYDCCAHGYALGFRTFVLQGGEDSWFNDERLERIVRFIKAHWADCAVTLSVGERPHESYLRLKQAGVDRFLLRHETADSVHFALLHPAAQTWDSRRRCLESLKACGYQTGAGFMVGTPWQTTAHLLKDIAFLYEFQPEMVGIGPFIPHAQTPFARFPQGNVERTLILLAVMRLLLPHSLLPSTTALGTADEDGREKGVLAGANVLMPNLSPKEARSRYVLYDNIRTEGAECADNVAELKERMRAVGYEIVTDRGDFKV